VRGGGWEATGRGATAGGAPIGGRVLEHREPPIQAATAAAAVKTPRPVGGCHRVCHRGSVTAHQRVTPATRFYTKLYRLGDGVLRTGDPCCIPARNHVRSTRFPPHGSPVRAEPVGCGTNRPGGRIRGPGNRRFCNDEAASCGHDGTRPWHGRRAGATHLEPPQLAHSDPQWSGCLGPELRGR